MISTIAESKDLADKPSIGGSSRIAYAILGVAFLHQLLLFSFFFASAWHRRTPERPLTLTGEGLVIIGDGYGYYGWVRSLLVNGDWSFDDERQEPASDLKASSRKTNHYPIGPACLWAPAVVGAHWFCTHFPEWWPANGYSTPYQLAVGLTSLGISGLTLLLLYRLCRLYARPIMSALAVTFLAYGTTLLNYQAIEVSMAHGAAAAATTQLMWYWLKTYGSNNRWRWLGIGACVGLAALMRYQLALLAVLPAGEVVVLACTQRQRRLLGSLAISAANLALAGIVAIAVFIPQMYAWKTVYGHWLVAPLPLAHAWLHPDFERVLFSSDRGFFYWTPMTVVLVASILWFAWRRQAPADKSAAPLYLLLAAAAVQAYLLASVTGDGVFLGAAFGYRLLTECSVLLAPGLALLLERSSKRRNLLVVTGCSALCLWNLLLMALYHREILPREAGADLGTLIARVCGIGNTWPFGAALFLAGPALMGLLILRIRAASPAASGARHFPFPLRPLATSVCRVAVPERTFCSGTRLNRPTDVTEAHSSNGRRSR